MARNTDTRLYEYAVIRQGLVNKDGQVTEKAELIVEPTRVLADNEEQATLLAGRAIPDEHLDDLQRISLVVRPF